MPSWSLSQNNFSNKDIMLAPKRTKWKGNHPKHALLLNSIVWVQSTTLSIATPSHRSLRRLLLETFVVIVVLISHTPRCSKFRFWRFEKPMSIWKVWKQKGERKLRIAVVAEFTKWLQLQLSMVPIVPVLFENKPLHQELMVSFISQKAPAWILAFDFNTTLAYPSHLLQLSATKIC